MARVPVTVLRGDEFGNGLGKVRLAQAADQYLRGLQNGPPLRNDDTGWDWVIGGKDRRKMGDNADLSLADSQAVAGLPILTRWAVLAESHSDTAHHNPEVQAIHRFYAPIQIGSKLYRAKLTIKDFIAAYGRRNLHALETIEMENAPLPGTLPALAALKMLPQQAQPTTVERTVSIAQLLQGAIRDSDGQPFRPETS